jgi:type II secretory pathway pseudopilin PulG
MTNVEYCRGACVKRLTNGFGAWHKRRHNAAFSLVVLIVGTAVFIILTGLVLSTVGYVQKKGARARAETEIAAMSAAC